MSAIPNNLKLLRNLGWRKPVSGNYYIAGPPGNTATGQPGATILRFMPFAIIDPTTITILGTEVVTAGDAGSVVRLGLYASDDNGQPSSLIIDAGTVPGDAINVADITLSSSLTLPPGFYYAGAVTQNVSVTDPTLRFIPTSSCILPIPLGTSKPTAGQSITGYRLTGITGALPASAAGFTTSGTPVRVHYKVA
jgi:hypothetical protein